MRRRLHLAVLAAIAVSLVGAGGAASAPHVPGPAARAVLADYAANDRFDGRHPCGAVLEAAGALGGPTDAPRPGALRALRRYARTVCPVGRLLPIEGGTRTQRRLARIVALRVGGVTLKTVRLHGNAVAVVSSQPQTVRGEWERELYDRTYAALAGRYHVPFHGPPAFDLWSTLPRTAQVAALDQRLASAAEKANAQVVALRTAVTPARAIALTLRVADPAAFLEHRALRVLDVLFRTRVPLLGFYVGLDDAAGRLVWATSRLPNEGAVFAIPRLDACSPVEHSSPGGAAPAPCPAH